AAARAATTSPANPKKRKKNAPGVATSAPRSASPMRAHSHQLIRDAAPRGAKDRELGRGRSRKRTLQDRKGGRRQAGGRAAARRTGSSNACRNEGAGTPASPVSTLVAESLSVSVPRNRSQSEKIVPKFVSRAGPNRT